MIKILGIDPGLRITGYGIILKQSHQLHYVASGTIKTTAGSLPERLKTIVSSLKEIINTYQPDCAAIEKVFVNINPQSTLLLGQARGAAISALVMQELIVAEYTALQIKQAVSGYGRASKAQMQLMIQHLLSLPMTLGPDSSDALGVAVTHAHSKHLLHKIAQVTENIPAHKIRNRQGRSIY